MAKTIQTTKYHRMVDKYNQAEAIHDTAIVAEGIDGHYLGLGKLVGLSGNGMPILEFTEENTVPKRFFRPAITTSIITQVLGSEVALWHRVHEKHNNKQRPVDASLPTISPAKYINHELVKRAELHNRIAELHNSINEDAI
jgi:hypothetical protein